MRVTAGSNFVPAVEFIAGATKPLTILELAVISANGTAFQIGFGRPAVKGVTPTVVLLQREDPGDTACLGGAAIVWATVPVSPVLFSRMHFFSNAVGAGVLWTWPNGFVLRAGTTAVVQYIVLTSQSVDINLTAEEL